MKNSLSYSRSSILVSLPVIGLSLVLCVLAAFFGQRSLAFALAFIFLFAAVSRLWALWAARHVEIRASSPSEGLFPDDEIEISLTVENRKFLPLIWLELFAPVDKNECLIPEDARKPDDWEFTALSEAGVSTDLVGEKRFPCLLWYETVETALCWKARRRGIYSMAAWRLRTGDGFGLTELELPLPEEDVREIAVYPRLIKVIPDLFLRNLWNSENGSRGVMEDLTVIRSTRDYMTTDSLKHINWRLAARGAPLSVNVFEDILPKSAHFIFDGNSFCGGAPHAEEMEESLSILASLAVRLERSSVKCGLSLPEGESGGAVDLFGAQGARTEELLRAMAEYEPEKAAYDKESGELVHPTPKFNESVIYERAKSAGRFYYVAYDRAGLDCCALLHALGEERATLLIYTEPEALGGFETVCLRHLREVAGDA